MFEIINLNSSAVPFSKKLLKDIKEKIIGKKYELSVVFLNNIESKKINKKYRNKNKSSNVLSFPIFEKGQIDEQTGKKSSGLGEIFINIDATKEAYKFEMKERQFLIYLYIHGLLHLVGYDHGNDMEKKEKFFLDKIYK